MYLVMTNPYTNKTITLYPCYNNSNMKTFFLFHDNALTFTVVCLHSAEYTYEGTFGRPGTDGRSGALVLVQKKKQFY